CADARRECSRARLRPTPGPRLRSTVQRRTAPEMCDDGCSCSKWVGLTRHDDSRNVTTPRIRQTGMVRRVGSEQSGAAHECLRFIECARESGQHLVDLRLADDERRTEGDHVTRHAAQDDAMLLRTAYK